MKTSLKITYAVLLFIGTTLITLNGATHIGLISQVLANQENYTQSRSSLISLKTDSWRGKHTSSHSQTNEEYEPPNYGGPDSLYGSGTR